MRAAVLLVALLTPARADTLDEAKQLFVQGREAFDRGDYQTAYDRFRRSFMLSSEPALLFNMSAAQQKLGRPHDAAESLRAYLRAMPDDPDRPALERRIRGLEEQQHMLDAEHPPLTISPPSPPLVVASPPPPHRSRRGLVIGLSVGAAVIVAAGVGIALGLTLGGGVDYTTSPLGAHPGTR